MPFKLTSKTWPGGTEYAVSRKAMPFLDADKKLTQRQLDEMMQKVVDGHCGSHGPNYRLPNLTGGYSLQILYNGSKTPSYTLTHVELPKSIDLRVDNHPPKPDRSKPPIKPRVDRDADGSGAS